DAARDYLPREYFGEVPEMQGDLTGDGVVDTADLNALAAVWGADTGAAESFLARHQAGDINYDGATDWFDIILLRELVTAQAASAAIGAAVPEPTTLCLLAAAAATPLQRRRVVRRAS
ncbi:MAG: PEP-CTERM sorting domain-containing protein, partial [Planctomycetota bacterium]